MKSRNDTLREFTTKKLLQIKMIRMVLLVLLVLASLIKVSKHILGKLNQNQSSVSTSTLGCFRFCKFNA